MTDTKILQAILDKVSLIESKMNSGFKEMKELFVKTDERIDKLGLQMMNLMV